MCHNFNFSYWHIESGLVFKNISSLANLIHEPKLNTQKKKFLHIKLLRKGIEEKLYFNDL